MLKECFIKNVSYQLDYCKHLELCIVIIYYTTINLLVEPILFLISLVLIKVYKYSI